MWAGRQQRRRRRWNGGNALSPRLRLEREGGARECRESKGERRGALRAARSTHTQTLTRASCSSCARLSGVLPAGRQLTGSCDFEEQISSALLENKCVQAVVVLRPTLVAERSGDPARSDG